MTELTHAIVNILEPLCEEELSYGLLELAPDIAKLACEILDPASGLNSKYKKMWLETLFDICQQQNEIYGDDESDSLISYL